ncbi:DUF2975 domain-containing protein [Nocardioides sp. URHA0020]|uniref:DUF2975 domain-containing protein n=1 Tax=Nocardioides sp. URHA0020 TaxID=1380392 RepID=UPI00048B01D0|nr:DUF2975 domain-containing protein [Nocardioides sp. URHA0020]
MSKTSRDPLAPIDIAVTALLALLAGGLALLAVIAIVDLAVHGSTDVRVLGIGQPTCVTAESGDVPWGGSGAQEPPAEGVVGLHTDVARQRATQAEVCLKDPTPMQQAAGSLATLGDIVFAVGGLLLVQRVVRTARRRGLFTEETADRTRQLGWFLLVMTLLWPVLAGAGTGVVLSAAVRDVSWRRGLLSADLSYTLLVVAIGVLTFARILRQAVPLQEEVDSTV